MTDELEKFYNENMVEMNDSFAQFCFYENRFETSRDAELHFNNDRYFWDFVENVMEAKRNWG